MPIGALIAILAAAAVGTLLMGRETGDRSWYLGTAMLSLLVGILLWLRLLAV